MKRSYYNSVSRSKPKASKIFMIICTVVTVLLVAFIVWAGITFGEYSDQGKDAIDQVNSLKEQLLEKDAAISQLEKDVANYKNLYEKEQAKVKLLIEGGATPSPTPSPSPSATPSSSPKTSPKASKKPAQSAKPSSSAKPSPSATPSPSPSPKASTPPASSTPSPSPDNSPVNTATPPTGNSGGSPSQTPASPQGSAPIE
mgnify:CR=1 FL=1